MRRNEFAVAEHGGHRKHCGPGFGGITLSPMRARDPVTEFQRRVRTPARIIRRAKAGAAHHLRIGRAGDQETGRERIGGQRDEIARVLLAIGLGRAGEIAHHAFVSDAGKQRLAVLGPDRPEQQSSRAMEHETSPFLAPRRP